MCEILQPASESLVRHYRLRDSDELNTVTEGLKQYMKVDIKSEVNPLCQSDYKFFG